MIKTPLSTVLGGAFWTPSCTVVGGTSKTLNQLIKSLFANGEQGFAYDPNDLYTMFQDAAGTVPVTAAGQPVGLVLDKSGRGNHAYQTTSASRPLLQRNATTGAYYLAFDGTDDFLVTSSINFTATDKISLFAGVRKLSDVAQSIIGLGSSPDTANGTFEILRGTAGTQFGTILRGTVTSGNYITNSIYAAPVSAVLSAKLDISGSIKQSLRVNNILAGSSTVSVGTGNYGNYPLYIGRRGGTSLPFNGHLYSLIGVARLSTDVETTNLEKAIAKNVGVTL